MRTTIRNDGAFFSRPTRITPSPSQVPARARRRNGLNGKHVQSATPVNQFYFYCIDADFGPFFLKFCTYFPYNAKLCSNGHEYVKVAVNSPTTRFPPRANA